MNRSSISPSHSDAATDPAFGTVARRTAAAEAQRAQRPRLGFLGVGWIGRHRMEAIVSSGAADIAAIADPSAAAAQSAQSLVPEAELAADLDDLLALDLDGVVIATPSALHAEQAIAAFTAGCAVFCQKPLGRNADEVRRVLEAARSANRLLGVDLSYRYLDAVQKMRTVVRSGALGTIYAADLAFHNAYGPDKEWFYKRDLSGGGCVIDLGIHLVDLALWMLDFPRLESVTSRLFAQGKPLARNSDEVEDYAIARLDLETGASVQISCSWKLHAGCDAKIHGSFFGTHGSIAFSNINGSFYDFIAERFDGTTRERLSSPPDAWGGRAAVDWARQLALDRSYNPAAEQLLPVTQALDHML